MALLTSLFAGVSGLRNHQTMMDVIGNNISNVNTIGFKGSRVTFSDTFNQFVKAGTNPTETTGGTNSYQVGLGMKVNSIDRNWNQGTFERTGIVTDLALQGPGLFVLESNGQTFFSRAGNFIFDGDGKLVSPQNGAIVQGKVANKEGVIPPGNNLEDIKIDTNLKLPAVATTEVKWGGNLKSNSDVTRTENVLIRGNIKEDGTLDGSSTSIETSVYNTYGEEFKLRVTYTETTNANEYNMSWDILDLDGNVLASSAADVTINFVDDGSGNMVLTDASKQKFDPNHVNYDPNTGVNVSSIGTPAGDMQFQISTANLSNQTSTQTVSMSADGNREPNVVSGSVTIFDSLGTAHQLTLKYTKLQDNLWTWTASVPGISTIDGQPVISTGTILFNADGTIDPANISPNNPQITFDPSGGANPAVIELDFGDGFSGITQTSSSSVVSALAQNGSATASLSNINIDQYGNIVGIFSNGSSRNLAQIMAATFNNLNGLISVGDNMYAAYANSGEPRIGSLGEETGTTVQSGALEQSNVDLSEEFTRMIVSQRGFQANARVITTADTLLQEITNLIR